MFGSENKFGLYLQHFENIVANKKTDKATLEGKFKQLTDWSILLFPVSFSCILFDPAKIFGLASQKEDFNVINDW